MAAAGVVRNAWKAAIVGLRNFARELRQEGIILQTKMQNIGTSLKSVDKFSNRYYDKLGGTQYGRHWWVEYASRDYYCAFQLPQEWYSWLHFITDYTEDDHPNPTKPSKFGVEHKHNLSREDEPYIYPSKGHSLNPGQRDWTSFSVARTMFISKFSKLGAGTVKNILNAPQDSISRKPLGQNQNLPPLMHRSLCTSAAGSDKPNEETQKISVTFVDKDGEGEKHIKVPVGMSMLEAAHENDVDLEGACEGSLACSTCHVIVMDVDYYNKLEDPADEENDMLDLAFGLTETSRLGCQIIASPEIDGIRLALPAATRNFAVDGYKPKPH